MKPFDIDEKRTAKNKIECQSDLSLTENNSWVLDPKKERQNVNNLQLMPFHEGTRRQGGKR